MRNPNGFGTVYKLKGNRRNPWTARVTIGSKPSKDGTRTYPEYRFLGYYRTQKEAKEALASYNTAIEKPPIKARITLESVYEKWSNKYYGEIGTDRIRQYESAWKVLTPLHSRDINLININTIENVFAESGKNKSVLTNTKTLLNKVYTYAVRHEYTTADKVSMVKFLEVPDQNPNARPRKRIPRSVFEPLWSNTDDLSMTVLMLIYTGVRVSELINLKTADVNIVDRYLTVRHSKTDAGVRDVPIGEIILPYFKSFYDANNDFLLERMELHKRTVPYNRYMYLWRKTMGNDYDPHDARHTFVSMLQEMKITPVILKSIVGHKNGDVTEHYTHIDMQVKLSWVDKLQ